MPVNPSKTLNKDFNASTLLLIQLDRAMEVLAAGNVKGFESMVFGIEAIMEPLKDGSTYEAEIGKIKDNEELKITEADKRDPSATAIKYQKQIFFRLGLLCKLMDENGVYGLSRSGRFDSVIGKLEHFGRVKDEEEPAEVVVST